jgi:hypothetical protein
VVRVDAAHYFASKFRLSIDTPYAATRSSALDSETWTRDVNEIRELGARNSTVRTSEQTTIGRFWFLVGPRTFNPIVRQAALAKNMDVVDCARLFALASIAGNDAAVAVFDAKFHYNFWRPITAIRNADITQNAATPRDESWLPLGDTPMHPEYPCAHCIVSAAVSTVLRNVVGDSIGEFSLTSPTAPGVTRKWSRIQDYSDEVANARIYAGFHYRFSTEVGKDMGRKIGELTVETQLRGLKRQPIPNASGFMRNYYGDVNESGNQPVVRGRSHENVRHCDASPRDNRLPCRGADAETVGGK